VESCVTDMDSLYRSSEEVNKVSDINEGHDSALMLQEQDRTADFTTDELFGS